MGPTHHSFHGMLFDPASPATTIDLLDKLQQAHDRAKHQNALCDPPGLASLSSAHAPPGSEQHEAAVKDLDDLFMMSRFYTQRESILERLQKIESQAIPSSISETDLLLDAMGRGNEKTANKHSLNMDKILGKVKKYTLQIKGTLSEIEQTNRLLGQAEWAGSKGHMRLRQLQLRWLERRVDETLAHFKHTQEQLKEKRTHALDRQYLIIRPDAPQDELDRLHSTLEEPSTEQLFQVALHSSDLKQDLSQLINRRNSMFRIEKKLLELSSLFHDLKGIAAEQGESIESVQNYVVGTIEYLQMANKDLVEAVQHQKNIQRMWCAIF